MTTPPRLPRSSSRPAAGGDSYVWLGVLWLVVLAGGFLALILAVVPALNLYVAAGILAFLAFNALGHFVLGRWVARHIAATMTLEEKNEID